jgi:hypothetical protein
MVTVTRQSTHSTSLAGTLSRFQRHAAMNQLLLGHGPLIFALSL